MLRFSTISNVFESMYSSEKKFAKSLQKKSLANHENLWWPVVVDLDMGKAEKCICILA